MAQDWTLILSAGGLRSLTATSLALSGESRPRTALIFVHDGRSGAATRLTYVQRQAEHFGVRRIIELGLAEPTSASSGGAARNRRLAQAASSDPLGVAPLLGPRVILAAVAQGLEIGADRLIWPVQCDGDFDTMTSVTEQLVLIRHLVSMETPVPTAASPASSGLQTFTDAWTPEISAPEAATIETPLLELTDKQLVELGGQLEAPWRLAWSCRMHGDKPCRVCSGCRRRLRAFESAGMIDPLDDAASRR